MYIGVPHTYTSHNSSAKVTNFRVFVRHLKTLPRHLGLERSSRMNQEFPPPPNSRSHTWIPWEVPILSGCRATWPPHIGLGFSPCTSHFRRTQRSHGHKFLPQQGLQSPSLLLRNSSLSLCLCLTAVPRAWPSRCPPLPSTGSWGVKYFLSKLHHITCTST